MAAVTKPPEHDHVRLKNKPALEWLLASEEPAIRFLARMGLARDARTDDAVSLLHERRLPDGRWRAARHWWSWPARKGGRAAEVVDWTRDDTADRMATLNALGVLAARNEL